MRGVSPFDARSRYYYYDQAVIGRRAAVLGGGFDASSQAIFDAFTTPPTDARKTAINNFVVALKAAGVWSLGDVLGVYAAADSQAAIVNWKNPGTFNGSASSVTFTADRGFTGDGGAGVVDHSFNPTTAPTPNFTQDSASLGIWVLTSRAGAALPDAGNASAATGLNIYPRFTDDNTYLRVNDASETGGFAVADSAGFYVGNRSSSSARQGYRNGASVGTYGASTSQALINASIVAGRGGSNFTTDQFSILWIGGSLTSGQVASFYSAALAYMQAVGAV